MDGNQNEINKIGTIYCKHCGNLNDKNNNFCVNCGVAINENISPTQSPIQSTQQVNNVQQPQNEKENNSYKVLMILLGVAAIALSIFVEKAAGFVLIAAIATLFSKTTRPFGLTVLIVAGVGFVIGILFIIILFGMCFAGLG